MMTWVFIMKIRKGLYKVDGFLYNRVPLVYFLLKGDKEPPIEHISLLRMSRGDRQAASISVLLVLARTHM